MGATANRRTFLKGATLGAALAALGDARALFGEEIILGLRRSIGVVLRPEHFRLFGSSISSQVEDGLLTINNGNRIALTKRGIEIANTVMAEYV